MKKINKFVFWGLFLFLILIHYPSEYISQIEFSQDVLAFDAQAVNNTKYVKNIAVFIEFADGGSTKDHHLDHPDSVANAEKIFNSDSFIMDTVNGKISVPSFKTYFERESYGALSISTEIFPKKDGTVYSYVDSHPIQYYLKYSSTNPLGYTNNDMKRARETELVNNATNYISNMVLASGITKEELDPNNDGKVDAITFVVEGEENLVIAWNDLLWSHKSDNMGITAKIMDKNVTSYTLLLAKDYKGSAGLFSLDRGTYGTIIHEYGHMLGFMDLYRFGDSSSKPVGFYDIMGNAVGSNPQSFLTYFISEYHNTTSWHSKMPEIHETTKNITLYKPKFIDKNEKRAIKVKLDGIDNEFFVIEYHDKVNTYTDYSADLSGIIVYRVNEDNKFTGNTDGSNQGRYDHVYIFRPNETALGAGKGNLSQATLNMTRPKFGKALNLNDTGFDNKAIFFTDGSNSGIQIEVVSETTDSVTFNVIYPSLEGSGVETDPYLIRDVDTYLYLMSLSTTDKYYKLMNDLDFKDIKNYPLIDFEGNFNGNNKTLKNITSSTGVFNYIGQMKKHIVIENLYIENLNVISSKGNTLGGFGAVCENATLRNIHIRSGIIKQTGTPLHDLVTTGGFVGNINNSSYILNCSIVADVSGPKHVGGLIGLNMNAHIENAFASGNISGNVKGGFIGLQSITDSKYNVPVNAYYKADASKTLSAVGGYAKMAGNQNAVHNLSVLGESSLGIGITRVYMPSAMSVGAGSSINVPIETLPSSTLKYNVSFKNANVASFTNQKIVGKAVGATDVYVDILVGTENFRLTSKLTVTSSSYVITEQEVLNHLGLQKKSNYVVGFKLGTKVSDIRTKLSSLKNVSFKSFTNINNVSITDGVVGTGMHFTLLIGSQTYSYTIVIKGDVNGDGQIFATDYVKVRNHIMGKSKLTGAFLVAADINNDGNIYATDYVLIRNYIMGKSDIVQR